MNTERFTDLTSKYAAFLSVYIYKRTQLFLKAFLVDICGVEEKPRAKDWKTDNGDDGSSYYFSRVEFTETRGLPHFHVLARLPHVLNTSLIGRMVQNSRVVREEIKRGNIRQGQLDKAFEIVEVRYQLNLHHNFITFIIILLSVKARRVSDKVNYFHALGIGVTK
jgi:hypothetical protein